MNQPAINETLLAITDWKQNIRQTLGELQTWLEDQNLYNEDAWNAFARCLDKLDTEQLRIAIVGELSRGKSELINALLFNGSKKNLLPSSAGSTTLCPTEILHDEHVDYAYLRLLPLETLDSDASLADLRQQPAKWTEYRLPTNDHEASRLPFDELSATRAVSRQDAIRYGFNPQHESQLHLPKWRHAIISYPHPLLKQGLTLLDTPGLNAIGHEAELTLTLLPSAQSILFLVSADSGVTRSDLDIWQQHLLGDDNNVRQRMTVILNKIDVLWDELRSPESVADTIKKQILHTAKTLGIPLKQIFPLSARQALIGQIMQDPLIMEKSGLVDLTEHLNHQIFHSRQQVIQKDLDNEVITIINQIRRLLQERKHQTESQLKDFQQLQSRSDNAIGKILRHTQAEQQRYRNNYKAFNACNKTLLEKSQELQKLIDPQIIELIIEQTHQAMKKSWTTNGIKQAIDNFSNALAHAMEEVACSTNENRKLIRSIYLRFQKNHGIAVIPPKMFSLTATQTAIETLLQQADNYRDSQRLRFGKQSLVTRNFINTVGHQAKQLVTQLKREISQWLHTSLQPLEFQIEDHRDLLSRQIHHLKLAHESRETLAQQIARLEKSICEINRQSDILRQFQEKLLQPPLDLNSLIQLSRTRPETKITS